jgi:predicted glutamine amidotransferase
MCRFTLYLGPPIRLDSLLMEPDHSLIRQSTHSRERDEPLNGDGFGVGWYATHFTREPAVFRSITPAWNNRNLHNLCRVVASDCILAHVRAATQSSGVNEANCHPFRFRQQLFMHNGDVGSFRAVRRRMMETVCDEAFSNVYGSTDTEHFFAVLIDELIRGGHEGDAADTMAGAMRKAIMRVIDLVARYGGGEPSYLNCALADGENAVVSRFTDSREHPPESLYYFVGDLYPRAEIEETVEKGADTPALIVSSERLTPGPEWQKIPDNHMVVLRRNQPPDVRRCLE